MTKGEIGQAMWSKLLHCYGQHGRTRVMIPAEDVMGILTSLMANVLSGVDDANEREKQIRDVGPRLDRLVTHVRSRTNVHIASNSSLILPN